MKNKINNILSNVVKLELRLDEVRKAIGGLGDMSSLLRTIKHEIKEIKDSYASLNDIQADEKLKNILVNFLMATGNEYRHEKAIEDIRLLFKSSDSNKKESLSKQQIEEIVKDMMALPSYISINSMAPTMKATFELGVECILKGTNIILEKEAKHLPELNYGDLCRAKSSPASRYMGLGKCLFISNLTNELTIDDVDLNGVRENAYNLPLPSDEELKKSYATYLLQSMNN